MTTPKEVFHFRKQEPLCQTFLENNLLIAGQLNGGQTPSGGFFFGKVYDTAVPSILSNVQLRFDLRPKCRVFRNCTLSGTFDQTSSPESSSFIGAHVYLIRTRQTTSPPFVGDFSSIVTDSSSNPQLPGGSPNQNIDFTAQSGPVYNRMEDLIYMQTFNANNVVDPRDYIVDYCLASDPRWADNGIRMNVGDRLWVVLQAGSSEAAFQANGGWNFNGHFNWDIKFADTK